MSQSERNSKRLKLADVLDLVRTNNIELVNELNEPLLRIVDVTITSMISGLKRWLSPELLERKVMAFWTEGEDTVIIKLEGMEDAE